MDTPRPLRKAPVSVHFGDEIPQINDPVEASRAEKGHEVHAEGSANLDWVPGWVEETDNALMQFRAWIVQLESKLEIQAQKQKPAEFQQ